MQEQPATVQLSTIKLRGHTYPLREVLRALDYHWDADQRAWVKHGVRAWEIKLALANTLNGRWPRVRVTLATD